MRGMTPDTYWCQIVGTLRAFAAMRHDTRVPDQDLRVAGYRIIGQQCIRAEAMGDLKTVLYLTDVLAFGTLAMAAAE